MTQSDFADALVGTRYRQPIRDALRMVFVDGMSQTDAAAAARVSRQEVNRAVASFKKKTSP